MKTVYIGKDKPHITMVNEESKLGVGGIEDVIMYTQLSNVKQQYILLANTNECGRTILYQIPDRESNSN